MSDLEDGYGESNKETPQEAEIDFDDVDFDINVSVDDDIQEIITENHPRQMGNQPWQKRLIVNLRLIELRAAETK